MNDDRTFRLNKAFLRELRKRLLAMEKSPYGIPRKTRKLTLQTIPTLNQLDEIISKVFWASLATEEGRPLRFRVGFSIPLGIKHVGLGLDLRTSKNFEVEELRKLAPAVVPPEGEICVFPFFGRLVISGLQTMRALGPTFEVLDPGRIVVRFFLGEKIAEITGQECRFISDFPGRRLIDVFSTLDNPTSNDICDMLISLLYEKMTKEILTRIRLLRHGGTIIFVSDLNSWRKTVESPITYNCDSCFNGLHHIEQDLRTLLIGVLMGTSKGPQADREIEDAFRTLAGSRYSSFLGDTARTVAYLTGVDGATILTGSHDVLAFGAKIKEQGALGKRYVTKLTPYEMNPPVSELLTHAFRGKRHLSAARFVLNNPNSRAFVVSQDGGITCFMMNDGDLQALSRLELLL